MDNIHTVKETTLTVKKKAPCRSTKFLTFLSVVKCK